MRIPRHIPGAAAILGMLVAYWIGSEIYYFRSISPNGVSTVADYFHRFGEPRMVHQIERDNRTYYMLSGWGPSALLFALPSSLPTYIFDDAGRFVEWCSDGGEAQSGDNERWPLSKTGRMNVGAFKRRFGL